MLSSVHNLTVGTCRLRIRPDIVQTTVSKLSACSHIASCVHLLAHLVRFDLLLLLLIGVEDGSALHAC